MSQPTLDDLLARSAPPSIAEDPRIHAHVRSVAARSRSIARASRRRTRTLSIALPLALVPAAAFGLTGGTDERLVPDVTIPITYTTDTGRTVACSIDLYNHEILYVETNTEVEDFVGAQDWTGVGQRIYGLALERLEANDPATLQPNEWPAGVINQPTPAQREQQAWVLAEKTLVTDPILANVPNVQGYGSFTDCTPAELH